MPEEQKKHQRIIPLNDLDFSMTLTKPKWGDDDINSDLKNALTREYFQYDNNGNLIYNHKSPNCHGQVQITSTGAKCIMCNANLTKEQIEPALSKKALWAQLSFFTQDFRLSNLAEGNIWKGIPSDIKYCEKRINLCNLLLNEGYIEPFRTVLAQVAARLELCQSKGGFLRKRMGTFTQENKSETIEPAKRTIFAGKNGVY